MRPANMLNSTQQDDYLFGTERKYRMSIIYETLLSLPPPPPPGTMGGGGGVGGPIRTTREKA